MSEGTAPAPLLGLGTWTKQGPATLVRRREAWAVLVPGTRKPVIEAAWTLLGEDPTAETFIERLVEAGELEVPEKLPALLLGVHDGTSVTLLVKGTTPLAVYTAEGAELVSGTEEDPVVLCRREGVRRIAFGELPAEEPEGMHRVVEGIVPVRGFVLGAVDPESLAEEERTALAAQVEADGRSIMDPEEKARRAARTPAPRATSSGGSGGALSSRLQTADRASGEMPPSLASSGGRSASPSRRPAATVDPAAPNMFADLLGGGSAAQGSSAAPAGAAASTAATSSSAAPTTAASTAAASTAAASTPASAELAPVREPVVTPEPEREPAQASAPAPAPEPAAVPRPAPAPEPVEVRAPVPAAPAPAAPAPAASTAAPAAPAGAPAGSSASTPRRRLVSTSLFDRPARTAAPEAAAAPVAASPASASPTPASLTPASPTSVSPAPASPLPASPAPASPVPAPATPAEETRVADHTLAGPSEEELTSPATLVAPIDEELSSPDTLIAPVDDGEGEDAPAEATPTPRPRRTAAPAGIATLGAYDDLFGTTVSRSIEDAAVRPVAEDSGVEEHTLAPTEAPPSPPSQPVPAAEPSAPAPVTRGTEDFIDWVPGVGRAAPEIAQAAARRAAAPASTVTDDEQIRRAGRSRTPGPVPPHPTALGPHPGQGAHREQPAPAAPAATPSGPVRPGPSASAGTPSAPAGTPSAPAAAVPAAAAGPSAPALPPSPAPRRTSPSGAPGEISLTGQLCPQGHANPPERDRCRICGAPLGGPTRTVTRPPLGVALLSTGGRIVLDRSAVIGRRPRASRVSAHEVPQLITVPSPQQDISRSHLELRLEGWHVLATDLGTTNGTTLHRPGYEPVRLRPREGIVLVDGDLLDLGDGVRLRFGERA